MCVSFFFHVISSTICVASGENPSFEWMLNFCESLFLWQCHFYLIFCTKKYFWSYVNSNTALEEYVSEFLIFWSSLIRKNGEINRNDQIFSFKISSQPPQAIQPILARFDQMSCTAVSWLSQKNNIWPFTVSIPSLCQ